MDFRITPSLICWSLLVLVPVLTEGSTVNLVASDENGKQINHLTPGTTLNLNCSYDVKPLYLNFYNGTDKNIFVKNFIDDVCQVGNGFEQLVKFDASGHGWLSIMFKVPYCYKDEVIKCMVFDQAANKHRNKREFPIGKFLNPNKINGTSCNGIISIVKQKEEFPLTCSVSGIQPQANFTWPVGCTASDPVSTEDTEKCLFDQTSTAICKMDILIQKEDLTCSAENGIGNGSCTLQINTGCENGCGDDNTLAIALGVTIPLIVIGVVAALAAFLIRRNRQKDRSPLADEIDMSTTNNSSDNRNNNGINPAVNPACDTGSMQGTPNDLSHDENDQPDHTAMDPSLNISPHEHQRQQEDLPEYPNIMLAHQRIAMQGQDKHSIPIYSTVKKPKTHPCDSSQPPPPYSKQDHMMPINDGPPDTREQSATVHPGLQVAMTDQNKPRYPVNPLDKPKPYPRNPSQRPLAYSNQDHMTPLNDGLPGSRQPYQPRYDDVPEYPDMVSAHPGLQAAIQGQDKPRFPVYSSDNKPKPYPRNPSHQRSSNT